MLGAVASIICYYAVTVLKPKLGYDDSLDAFGIHGIGGMVGAIGTGIVYQPSLGGPGDGDFAMGAQVATQIIAVLVSIVWAAVGTAHRHLHRQGASPACGSAKKSNAKASTSASMASAPTISDETGYPPPLSPLSRAAGSYRGSSCEPLAGCFGSRPFFVQMLRLVPHFAAAFQAAQMPAQNLSLGASNLVFAT